MDKLEKALEKARLLRHLHIAAASGVAREPAAKIQDVPVGTISVSAEVLEENRILAHRTRSPEADLFRLLRAQVLQAMAKQGMRTLAITSPNYGEGKTTVSTNLARASRSILSRPFCWSI